MALDVGSVRIGVAVTDPLGLFAQGIAVWQVREGNQKEGWRVKFEECLNQYKPALVLIGMPRRTDGKYGPEAERINRLVDELRAAYPEQRIETWDERYTTVLAQRALLEGDVSRKKRKERVDKIAAAFILQNWLDTAANSRLNSKNSAPPLEAE